MRRALAIFSATPILFALTIAGCGPADDGLLDEENVGTAADALLKKCGALATGAVQGYDVSTYQGNFDWKAAKDRGRAFGIARVSSGTNIVDETFGANWAGMKANGIIRGAYQYFQPGQSEVAQANLVIERLGRLGPGDLPAMIDVETTGGQSPATVVARARHWMELVEAGTGKRPIIYTGAYFWKDQVADDKSLGGYPLMIPNYNPTDCPLLPGAWTDWVIWQYGDGAGKLDHDVFNGTLADLQRFAGLLTDYPKVVRRTATDIDGDGAADLCGRGIKGIECKLSGSGDFAGGVDGPAWSDAKGWSRPEQGTTIAYGDIDGDGKADVCGRDKVGVACHVSTGRGFGAELRGPAWGDAQGWNKRSSYDTIQLADVNGDGKDDVCGRGSNGFTCFLSNGRGFPTEIKGPAWSDKAGWAAEQRFATIQLADVDGDGKADVCGRGEAGISCFLSNGTSFPTRLEGPAWMDEGWSAAARGATIRFADIDGDGRADVCGRAARGIVCARSTGTAFGPEVQGPAWSDESGWAAERHFRTIQFADVNGDGRQDVCGRGPSGMRCWLSDGETFSTEVRGPEWSDAAGWAAPSHWSTVTTGDVNHDGKDDLCGRDADGLTCALATGSGFAPAFGVPTWSDAVGWGRAPYYESIRMLGHVVVRGDPGRGPSDSGPGADVSTAVDASADGGCAIAYGRTGAGGVGVALALLGLVSAGRRRGARRRAP